MCTYVPCDVSKQGNSGSLQVMTRSDTGDMTCQCVEDKVPAVWASSQACSSELGDHLLTVRTAV